MRRPKSGHASFRHPPRSLWEFSVGRWNCGWLATAGSESGIYTRRRCCYKRWPMGLPKFAFFVLACSVQLAGAQSNIMAPGATLQKLAGGMAFAEGPACDDKGNVFFTDQPNNRILEWSAGGHLSTVMQSCGRANGL